MKLVLGHNSSASSEISSWVVFLSQRTFKLNLPKLLVFGCNNSHCRGFEDRSNMVTHGLVTTEDCSKINRWRIYGLPAYLLNLSLFFWLVGFVAHPLYNHHHHPIRALYAAVA